MTCSVDYSVQWAGASVACGWQSAFCRRHKKILRQAVRLHEVIWEAAVDMLGSNTPAQVSNDK